jgi:uncharacterized protein
VSYAVHAPISGGALSEYRSLMRTLSIPHAACAAGAPWWLLAALCAALPAHAIEYPEKPPETDYFVDRAELIESDDRAQINAIASALLAEQQIPIFVVTVSSLAAQDAAGKSVEEYARALFDHWGIGFQDRNYGMLLLVARGDRKARIELGADWAGRHDAGAASVMNELIIPAFKRGDFSTGIVDGVRGMDAMARGLALPRPTPPWWFWPAVVIGGIGFIVLVVNLFKTGRSGWAWALIIGLVALLFLLARSGASGSGGGFGGGGGGGGGATGSW